FHWATPATCPGCALSTYRSLSFARSFSDLLRMLLLCQVEGAGRRVAVDRDAARAAPRSAGGDGGRGVGLKQVPDAAGEVALEAADRFAPALAFGLFAGEVGDRLGVQAALGDRESVQRAVELAVAATVEAVPLGLSGGGGDRGRAG